MSIRTWWKGLFGPGESAQTSAGGLLAGILQAGQAPRRGTRELLLAYKRLPMVHAVVHRIAHDVAAVPLKLYRAKGGRTSKYFNGTGVVRRSMIDDSRRTGDLEEVTSHPFLDMYNRMNPALGGLASRAINQVYVELAGESYQVKERNGLGLPVELWPVPPHWIYDIPRAGWPNFRASWMGWQKVIAEDDMLWMKHADTDNPYGRGAGTGTSLADELDIDEYSAKHIRNWFHNGAMPSAIVSLEGASKTEVERYGEEWLQKLRGNDKAHQIKFTNGKLQVQNLTDTFRDQELVKLRNASKEIIRETFGVPPEIMGTITNSNRATIESAYFLYSTGVLCPRLDFLVSAYQSMVDEFDERLVLDYVSPVPEDKEFRQKQQGQIPSAFKIDEHRAVAGLAPLEDGEGEGLYGTDTYNKEIHIGLPSAFKIDEHRALAGLEPLEDGAGDVLWEPPIRNSEALLPVADPNPPTPGAGDPPVEPGPGPTPDAPAVEPKFVDGLIRRSLPEGKAADGGGSPLSDSDITRVLEALKPEHLTNQVTPIWKARLDRWGNRVLDELGVDVSFDIRNPLVRAHLEHFAGNKMRDITSTTADSLRLHLSEGAAAGEGIDELAQRVSDVFDIANDSRAEMIARTEVVGSSNFANLEAFKMSGVVESKEWLAVPDSKTREAHAELDGKTVGLLENFEAGGYSGSAPGQFGEASMDIGCRCSVLPVVAELKSNADRRAVWKRFDTRAAAWERVAVAALRKGFKQQKADVLAKLRAIA